MGAVQRLDGGGQSVDCLRYSLVTLERVSATHAQCEIVFKVALREIAEYPKGYVRLYNHKSENKIMMLKKYGYLAGFLLGDGSAHHNKSNRAYEVTIDQILHNKHLMKRIKSQMSVFGKVHHYPFNSPDGEKYRMRVYSKPLYLQVLSLKTDPIVFFKDLDSKERLEFIGGYIDADGTFSNKKLILYSKNKGLLEEIKKFLKNTCKLNSAIYGFNASSFNLDDRLIYGLQFSTKHKPVELLKSIPSVKLGY